MPWPASRLARGGGCQRLGGKDLAEAMGPRLGQGPQLAAAVAVIESRGAHLDLWRWLASDLEHVDVDVVRWWPRLGVVIPDFKDNQVRTICEF